jgi:hypothetical protein
MQDYSALFDCGVSDALLLASLISLTKLDFSLLPQTLPVTEIVHVLSSLTCLKDLKVWGYCQPVSAQSTLSVESFHRWSQA